MRLNTEKCIHSGRRGQWKIDEGKLKNSRPPWVGAVITLPFFSPHPSLPRQTKFWHCCPPAAPTLRFLSIISLFLRHLPALRCWLALSASWSLRLSWRSTQGALKLLWLPHFLSALLSILASFSSLFWFYCPLSRCFGSVSPPSSVILGWKPTVHYLLST